MISLAFLSSFIIFSQFHHYAQGTALAAGQCYECASSNLVSKWQVTGFPNKPKVFDNRCLTQIDALSTASAGAIVSCSGLCIINIFQDPDAVKAGATTDTELYNVVRGCWSSLMGYTPTVTPQYTNKIGTGSCIAGEGTGFAEDGSAQKVIQMQAFCPSDAVGQASVCTAATMDAAKTVGGVCATAAGITAVSCTSCRTTESNCNGGTPCTGVYCFKAYETVAGRREVLKTCMYMNPYAEARCVDVNTSPYVPLRANVQIKGRQCYCKTANCNSGTRIIGSFLGILAAAFAISQFSR